MVSPLLLIRYGSKISNIMKAGRITFEGYRPFGLNDVLHVGRNNNRAAIRPLAKHVHEGCYEIFYLARGSQVMGASGKGYVLGGGDLFVARPGEVHSTGMHPVGTNLFYWVQLKPGKRFLGLPSAEAQAICDGLATLPSPHFKGDRRVQAVCETLLSARELEPTPLTRARLRHAAVELALLVIECAERPLSRQISEAVMQAVAWIDAHVEEPLRAEHVASAMGLSASRIRARFKDETGLTLQRYILHRKVQRAVELMDTTKLSITEIAYRLSFSSSQYFATVFKRIAMRSPTDFAADVRPIPPTHLQTRTPSSRRR